MCARARVAQELAGTAHYDVMRELLATTEAKVMLAIDEYNELFQMSHWHYGDDKASRVFFCGDTVSRGRLVRTRGNGGGGVFLRGGRRVVWLCCTQSANGSFAVFRHLVLWF